MSLFSPAYRSRDPEERLKAVAELSDQNILAELAKNDDSPRVRQAAVAKVTDQELLVDIALNGKEIDARVAAVERIESQQKLAEIIKVRKNFELMGACFQHITDKTILEAIANDPSYNRSARRMAIESYADESFLAEASQTQAPTRKEKTPEEIHALMNKYGGVRLARALGRFRGSTMAMKALGDIMRQGGEGALVALEYLAHALAHANPDVSKAAHAQLVTLTDGELIARLVGLMSNAALRDKILDVLRHIDHPDAKQVVEAADSQRRD